MNNHSLAIACALIGAGFGGFISASSGSFLPVVLGLLIGCFAGYFIAGLIGANASLLLQKKFQEMGTLRGKTLDEIVASVGAFSSMTPCHITDRNNEQGKIYTWNSDNYEIKLLFGADGICVGVNKETIK